jgi:hypothetical protein
MYAHSTKELGYSIQSINPCYMYWAYVVSY